MTLQTLVTEWHQHHGMITALLHSSPLVCLQVDRYIQLEDGTLRKFEEPIQYGEEVLLPVFQDAGIEIEWTPYHVVSAIAHLGTDQAGHCRTLLRTGNGHESAFRTMVTEDNCIPEKFWDEPFWFKSQAISYWLCKVSHVDKPQIAIQDSSSHRDLSVTFLQAVGKAMRDV